MRVLGVDPGLTRCGIGVVEGSPGRPLTMVEVGVVRTPPSAGTPQRLLQLQAEMEDWVGRHRPDAVAIERVFADINVATVMGTAQASAVAMLAAASRGIPVHLHTPTEVKAAVTGSGRADKAQVTAMVTRLLRLAEPPKPADAADALALAICHVWRGGAQARLEAAVARERPVIASVRGTVLRAGLDSVVVEVGGVGMLVHTTPRTAAGMRSGQTASLATSLVVREESLTLYGFGDDDERALFEQVQTVSGVGPRLALAMLAVHSPDAVRAAVSQGDLVALTKVPGIGRKGAERIVLELRDKIGVPAGPVEATDRPVTAAWQGQVREALIGLGWTARQADDAVEAVAPQAAEGATVSALLRAALQELGR